MVILDQIMRLEQRVTCLQNANNVNSCATCRLTLPIHVIIPSIEPNKQNIVEDILGIDISYASAKNSNVSLDMSLQF